METFTTHKADITALAVTDDELNLYCSGVDPTMVNFVRVQDGHKKQSTDSSVEEMEITKSVWAKDVQKNVHEHDVRYLKPKYSKALSTQTRGVQRCGQRLCHRTRKHKHVVFTFIRYLHKTNNKQFI